MARQPEVFVRELDPAEAQRLVKITRTARDRVRLRRAGIVLASVQGRSPAEAAAMFAATAQYAREVIHAFNEQGFAALDPKWSGGRPRKFGSVAREIVCRVAKTAPQQLGLPFTTWSLTKLVEHLAQHRIVVSAETVPSTTGAPTTTSSWCSPRARVLAELDRVRVHRAALLHPRRQRLPLPRRPGGRDRRLRPLGQPPRQTQTSFAVGSKIRRPDYLPNVA